ncbi:MAG TPA: DinB family protein [Steroidobacteraceae bacterium]|nr:DinB family protein [Steroidobacteraceae bacterium]
MKEHFQLLARYNRWANTRLYRAAATLADEQYRRDAGAFFKSLHGTLNHLLVADRIWMRRLTGSGPQPHALDAIVHEDLASLGAARQAEDARIEAYVQGLAEHDLEAPFEYRTLAGAPYRQRRREVLAHLFNHQTHHRGQAHAILTAVGVAAPPPLDLLVMQRELGA